MNDANHRRRSQIFPLDPGASRPEPEPVESPGEIEQAWRKFYHACGLHVLPDFVEEIMRASFYHGAGVTYNAVCGAPRNFDPRDPSALPGAVAAKKEQIKAIRAELEAFSEACGEKAMELLRG